MEEVTGSIPVRSTTLTPAESKKTAAALKSKTKNRGTKRAQLSN
jgi:hypothetical protein